MNNGLLPIQLSETQLHQIFRLIEEDPDTTFIVNLEDEQLLVPKEKLQFAFEISPYKKECLLNGYDDFDYLQSILPEVEKFEQKRAG